MPPPQDDRRASMTPQLALRVAVVGSLALALFAIVFFRLWFLQVLSTTQYAKAAVHNKTRNIVLTAPRGEITDRFGNPLVESQLGFDVELEPSHLPTPVDASNFLHPPANDLRLYRRLDRVLGLSRFPGKCQIDNPYHPSKPETVRLADIPCAIVQQLQQVPYDPVTIAPDVKRYVQIYIGERQTQFHGVSVAQVYQRQYPQGQLAAQVLGTVGPISPGILGLPSTDRLTTKQINRSRYKGLGLGAQVGQSGLEFQYDRYLRGIDGTQPVEINAFGQFEGTKAPTEPTPGDTLQTTLDTRLQQVGETALQHSIAVNVGADGGAFVAMDPTDGEIYAMGSAPTYSPSDFTAPQTVAQYNARFGPGTNAPQLNRAIASAGPTGSTFKMITAVAALQSGAWAVNDTYDDTGTYKIGALTLHNSGHAANGVIDLVRAIQVSDDIFFYHLGALMNVNPVTHPNGGALQRWAARFGIGRPTGIDLPSSVDGTLPSPRFVNELVHLEHECESGTGPYAGKGKKSFCGIAEPDATWTIGDNINTGVGQGDDQVTPLQLAVAYGALANGGTVVTPHLGLDVQSSDGNILSHFTPSPQRHLDINPVFRQTIMTGLRDAASQPGGTSYDVFHAFGLPVYGKTGTAQYFNAEDVETDYSWYACFVTGPGIKRPIVVIVTVEKGGFGDVAAAPVARQILSQWYYHRPGPYIQGSSPSL